jgi:type IV pilus assembly protein PilY1
MGDIYVGGQWRTIVVGGLGGGGRGYYALDVTNPVSPTLLWEFSNNNLGLTFGNPIITKRADGTWVVVFASGYNNVSPGDGNGHLFVVNAATGALLMDVPTYTAGSTPAGTAGTPSGLTKINSWTDSDTNNLVRRFYGGDLMGNLWRFDIDNLVQPYQRALLLAELKTGSTPQSIMVKPALGEVTYNGVNYPVVYVATGRYLGTSDLTNTTVQAVYAIKDPLIDSSYGNINASSALVTNILTAGTDSAGNATRAVTVSPVDWSAQAGWKAEFPGTGERVSVNPQLVLSTLYVGTNLPSSDACTVGGSSFLYKFDMATGAAVANQQYIGTYVGNVLIQGLTTVQLQGGASVGSIVTILTRSDATLGTDVGAPPSLATGLRRTSWRELVD